VIVFDQSKQHDRISASVSSVAQVSMKLSKYLKIEPGYLEEIIFYDHPSGAMRVRMAMEWKARNANAQ